MLRSIFSLFQNIIDSDREYNKKNSNTVIYLVTNPVDHKINMDLEIDGKRRQTLKSVEAAEPTRSSKYFTITSEQGDAVTCEHAVDIPRPKKQTDEKKKDETQENCEIENDAGDKPSFSYVNEEPQEKDEKTTTNGESQEVKVGMSVRELLASLPQKKTPIYEKDKEQLGVLLEQIQKMKKGMERLHQIAKQFTCSDKFKQDVDFLLKNLNQKSTESTDNNKLSPSEP
ncbi:uncharacterized protein LOC130892574 [Diorhabda carinulata]|uniref:uncharacterized protein LOC130892574 n=1 Tax=Diorhabda carinulata TaxID=1163345 RepID=UPI0025A27BBF|nr:uncharacterized protein LOC130892574 [Diorhabda carinulata]